MRSLDLPPAMPAGRGRSKASPATTRQQLHRRRTRCPDLAAGKLARRRQPRAPRQFGGPLPRPPDPARLAAKALVPPSSRRDCVNPAAPRIGFSRPRPALTTAWRSAPTDRIHGSARALGAQTQNHHHHHPPRAFSRCRDRGMGAPEPIRSRDFLRRNLKSHASAITIHMRTSLLIHWVLSMPWHC